MVELYIYDIHKKYSYSLPKVLVNHINKYINERRRNESLITYSHLAYILESKGFDTNNISFTELGKPELSGIHFSIAHSDNYSVIAIGDNSIGVDVEELISNDRLNLSKKILTDNEYKEYELSINKNEYLTSKWVLKEAYGKALGTGLASNVLNTSVDGYIYRLNNAVVGVYPNDNVVVRSEAK